MSNKPNKINDKTVYFSKTKLNAIIPTKIQENAGYDIYACLGADLDYVVTEPHKTVLIPTGIASAFSDDYVFVLKERGSTGTKGIGQRAGIIDSGFRNEWFVPITNHNNIPLIISKFSEPHTKLAVETYCGISNYIYYPTSKAVCQALLLPVPKVTVLEIPYSELAYIESERGTGMLGSSGK